MTEAALAATTPALEPAPALRAVPEPPARATPLTRRLEIPTYDLSAALALQRELGISHVLAQVLVRRGLTDATDARDFLNPSEAHPPEAFDGIGHAVEVIQRHIRSGSRITVHGDYDVDGVCATAVMLRALRSLGAEADWFLPSRLVDGYGLSNATVQRLAARGTRLLITVDCGITAVDEVAAARAGGIEVVLTDHHAPRADGKLPACPIVHPEVCGYPCRDLCGTAVAYKLAQALGASSADQDLELVALATVADLMPLQGENRRLVRDGLAAMANTTRPGLRALMAVAQADPSALDSHALGFRLAPRINAAGRLRRPDAGLELLLTGDPRRAAEVAAELDAVNAERRAVEQRIDWEAERQVAELGDRPAYVLASEGWHPGVIGIVASRIVERHHRPTILVALDGDSGTGSGRSIPGFDLLGALHSAASCMNGYGGHRAAAGLTIDSARVGDLRDAIERHAESVLTADLLQPLERVDAIASGADLGLPLAEELARLEPCGLGNPHVRLLVPGARFGDLRTMGEGRHARFSVISGGVRASAVAFGCGGKVEPGPGEPCDATFRLQRNVWNGAVEPRLVLRHAQPCKPAPIEVLGEPRDYMRAVIAELDAPLEQPRFQPPHTVRMVLDRRGEGPLSVLADALCAGGSVLAVCADVPRRLEGLRARAGGFALISYGGLELDSREHPPPPAAVDSFRHVVVLDPPTGAWLGEAMRAGSGYTHLAWGVPELRFTEQMHELEYGLRASLTSLYRDLRSRERVAGEELERLLRGSGPHGRPARVAGRLIRILAELELVSLDRDLPALAIAGRAQTSLDRSQAYRAYMNTYEDGRRFLKSANPVPSA